MKGQPSKFAFCPETGIFCEFKQFYVYNGLKEIMHVPCLSNDWHPCGHSSVTECSTVLLL